MTSQVRGDPATASPGVGQAAWVNEMTRKRQDGPSLRLTDHGEGRANWQPSTLAVRAGTHDDPTTGAVGTPIYQTSTFILGDDQYQAVEEGYARDRFIYTRYGNPSQWAVQEKLAALEGAESAIVFSSGMAAISATVLSMLDKGAHVVASNELYGGTYNLFHHELPSLGFSVSYVNPRDLAAIEAAIRPNTMLLYFETVTNPLLKVVDVPALGQIAARHQLRFVVDATFTTPLGMHPLEHGAHVVVHSCTKYLNGHSDLVAGVAMGALAYRPDLAAPAGFWRLPGSPRLLHAGTQSQDPAAEDAGARRGRPGGGRIPANAPQGERSPLPRPAQPRRPRVGQAPAEHHGRHDCLCRGK